MWLVDAGDCRGIIGKSQKNQRFQLGEFFSQISVVGTNSRSVQFRDKGFHGQSTQCPILSQKLCFHSFIPQEPPSFSIPHTAKPRTHINRLRLHWISWWTRSGIVAQGADICVNLWELLWRWCWVLEVGCWVLGVGGCGCCCCFPRLATFFLPESNGWLRWSTGWFDQNYIFESQGVEGKWTAFPHRQVGINGINQYKSSPSHGASIGSTMMD